MLKKILSQYICSQKIWIVVGVRITFLMLKYPNFNTLKFYDGVGLITSPLIIVYWNGSWYRLWHGD